jgi:hypothetical protein
MTENKLLNIIIYTGCFLKLLQNNAFSFWWCVINCVDLLSPVPHFNADNALENTANASHLVESEDNWEKFNSLLENSSTLLELFQSDKSMCEKLSEAQEILGEDSAARKALATLSNLSKTQENIVGILSAVGEVGLPEEHIKAIAESQNENL